jgi:hypothetical protein
MATQNISRRLTVACRHIDHVDHAIALTVGETMHYDRLVFPSGKRMRMLYLTGADAAGIYMVCTLGDSVSSLAMCHAHGPRKGRQSNVVSAAQEQVLFLRAG